MIARATHGPQLILVLVIEYFRAERVGFEPTELIVRLFSDQAGSIARQIRAARVALRVV